MPKIGIDIPAELIERSADRWRITELALFGSVLRPDFRADSDIDVLVRFEPSARHSLFDLIGMADELGEIVGRRVHLVEPEAIRNPFRRRSILSSYHIVYAA